MLSSTLSNSTTTLIASDGTAGSVTMSVAPVEKS